MVLEGKSYLTAPIEWSQGADPEYPYEAEHEGHKLLVRLNDFPETELYALIADGEEITSFDDWPDSWTRPSVSAKNCANSPGEILLEKEAVAFPEKVIADLYLEVKRELDNSSPTDIRVVTCWGDGMNLKQISEVTGIPISTVQRHLKAWQKRILQKTVLKDPEHGVGAYEVIQNAVKKFTHAA